MKINKRLSLVTLASAAVILFLILISSAASAAPGTYNVVGTHYKYWSSEQYPAIDMFGDKYVPLLNDGNPIWKSHVNKLAKLVIDSDDKCTLQTGEILDLGEGYSIYVVQVDVDGEKVWIEFMKDGEYVDDELIDVETGDSTWDVKLDDLQGEDDVVVLKLHVNQVLHGGDTSIAQIDGLWIIDYENTTTLKVGDKFKGHELIMINNGVGKSNLGSLVFEVPFPVAVFSATPTSGNIPLKVTFTDKSTGSPTSWKWSFGDGASSTLKNPSHKYSKVGKYTVSLTVKNAAGSNMKTLKNYIDVKSSVQKPVAAFSASTKSGKAPLKVQFTDKSTNSPTSWKWSFGDGKTSTSKSPAHTYTKAGKYTVSLTVKNAAGSNTKTISNYITVKSK